MVKIRLEGTYGEVSAAKEIIGEVFEILSVSEPYANRGESEYVRVYINAEVQSVAEEEQEDTTTHRLMSDVITAIEKSKPHNRVSVYYEDTENEKVSTNVGEAVDEK